MEINIYIEATGPCASGKTHELDKVRDLLESRGYRVDREDDAVRPIPEAPKSEILEMSRKGIWTS